MLRVSKLLLAASAATAMFVGDPALAQGGLAGKLDAAEQKLAQDSQSCTPINLGDYQSLLNEAAKNKKRAEKAKKSGAPVDDAQVDADLAKASALFNRALNAHVQQCVRQATTQAAQQPGEAMNLSPFARDMLALHNAARAAVGAPPLKWSPRLEAYSTNRARQNAEAGQLVHGPREGRGTVRENILQAPAGYSTAQMMDRWTRERAQFKPGIFPDVCTTGGDCSNILHYSQVIWPDTTEVGCGEWPSGGTIWVVCGLDPGGNKDGKPVGMPVQIAENETVRPRLVGGDYSGNPAAAGTTVNNADPNPTLRTASQFDLGIYAGGAWTTDWFSIGEPPLEGYADQIIGADPVPPPRRHSAWYVGGDFGSMIVEDMDLDFGLQPTIPSTGSDLNHEYGYDAALFIGYDLGAFRIEAETAYQKADQGQAGAEVDTKVEQPKMPGTEVFNANQPKVTKSGKQEPSNRPQCDPAINFWDAEKMYEAAKEKGDVGGMEAAKGLMQAAIGRQWQTMEHVTEAGEMTSMSGGARYSLGDFLGKMMDSYKDTTGGLPPGYYESPNGYTTDIVPPDPAAPGLPASEVFNPADAPKCPLDVM